MAVWQFKCEFVPRRWLNSSGADPDTSMDQAELPVARWWRNCQPQVSVIRFCDERYERTASADGTVLIWHAGEGSEIKVHTEGESIGRISADIDVRHPYHEFATMLLELSVLSGAMLYLEETGRFVEPELETLTAAIGGSEAARFVRNPESASETAEAV